MLKNKIVRPSDKQSLFQKFCTHYKAKHHPVILFGAGDQGLGQKKYLESIGIPVAAFCDNDTQKQGTVLKEVPVISLNEVVAWNKPVEIIVNDSYYKEKFAQLTALNNPLLHTWRFDLFSPIFKHFDQAYIDAHMDKFEWTYERLEDTRSKEVLCGILSAVCTGDLGYYDLIKSCDEYFPTGITPQRSDHVFLDVGAFDGNTCQAFAAYVQGQYEKIYAFEPIPASAERVKQRNIPRLELHQIAASNQSGTVPFWCNNYCDTPMATTVQVTGSSDPQQFFNTDTIDHVLSGQKVTFIKMDIEGSELAALEGAAQTIQTNRPFLAICVYHKREDLITIPQYLKQLVPEYKFYLRHHSSTPVDTVLYCCI